MSEQITENSKAPVTEVAEAAVNHARNAGESSRTGAQSAISFLRKLYDAGPWTLTAIAPDKKAIDTQSFGPASEADCERWIAKYEKKRNIYFSINELIDPEQRRKASKDRIKAAGYIHCDLDYRAGEDHAAEKARILGLLTERLPAAVPAPTAVWFSGGGFWACWKIAEPVQINGDVAKAEDFEQHSRWIEMELGGDRCHNIDRIARLPGTTNIQDAKKLAKGRVVCTSELVLFDERRVYPLDVFGRLAPAGDDLQGEQQPGAKGKKPKGAPKPRTGGGDLELEDEGDARHETRDADIPEDRDIRRIVDIGELDAYAGATDTVKVAIVQGSDPEHPKEGDNSRSAWLFHVICRLMRAEVPDEVIYSIITDDRFRISDSVLEWKRGARKYALRQIRNGHHATYDFSRDDKGRALAGQYNISKALTRLGIVIRHNTFANQYEVEGLPGFGPELSDEALTRMRLLMESKFRFLPQKDYFYEVVTDLARYNPEHPVLDYLRSLCWDGKPRIDTWLIDHAGAEDTPLTRAVGRIWLMAACRRVTNPGCKFDEMLVLESPTQGMDKSSGLAALCQDESWFSDDLPLDAVSKEVIEQTQGRWIIECGELKGMRAKNVEHMKAFLARRADTARMAYAKIARRQPRQCVFAGSTNESEYLVDKTGNRRFWPVRVQRFNVTALREARDQLWAEAYQRADQGESIRLDPTLYAAAGEEQARRLVHDGWEDILVDELQSVVEELVAAKPEELQLRRLEAKGFKIPVADVWKLLEVKRREQNDLAQRLVPIMRKLGWEKTETSISLKPYEDRKARCWVRGDKGQLLWTADPGGLADFHVVARPKPKDE